MDNRQRQDLDRHITGNWGEDSVGEDENMHYPDPIAQDEHYTVVKRFYNPELTALREVADKLHCTYGDAIDAAIVFYRDHLKAQAAGISRTS